jgi:SAM-dependent methyltransferase
MGSLYDRIGGGYQATRQPDPRIAALIDDALGDARTVVNVGAGTGAYEPRGREVLAVEPSETMIAQRPPRSASAIQANAEELPLADDSFDAALAVNTVQQWTDLRAGLSELRRVARRRIVIFLRNPRSGDPFWLVESYLPALDPSKRMAAIVETIEHELRPTVAIPVLLPRDTPRSAGTSRTSPSPRSTTSNRDSRVCSPTSAPVPGIIGTDICDRCPSSTSAIAS